MIPATGKIDAAKSYRPSPCPADFTATNRRNGSHGSGTTNGNQKAEGKKAERANARPLKQELGASPQTPRILNSKKMYLDFEKLRGKIRSRHRLESHRVVQGNGAGAEMRRPFSF